MIKTTSYKHYKELKDKGISCELISKSALNKMENLTFRELEMRIRNVQHYGRNIREAAIKEMERRNSI